MPVPASVYRAYIRKACRASKNASQSLEDYLEGVLDKNTALTGRSQVQSTSHGGLSVSYFTPGQGGTMTASDEAEFLDWALCCLPKIEADLEAELGRPPTPEEICSALIMAVPPGVTEVANNYTGLRGGCGSSCF